MTKKKTRKKMQDDVRESAQKIWFAGLGALSLAEEEGTKLFTRLVKEGESFEKRGRKQIEKVQEKVEDVRDAAETRWDKLGSTFDERVAGVLNRLGVPSRHEIQRLTKRVEELTTKVDQINKRPRARAKTKTRTRKTAKA